MTSPADLVPITDERLFYVLLQSEDGPSSKELVDFIEEGSYFDEQPSFIPADEPAQLEPLSTLQVMWDADRPPTCIEQGTPDECVHVVSEVREVLDGSLAESEWMSDSAREARGAVPLIRQVVRIVVDGETMTDEAWVMLDCLNAYLATTFSGFVYVPGDGLFDAKLQPIVRRRPK